MLREQLKSKDYIPIGRRSPGRPEQKKLNDVTSGKSNPTNQTTTGCDDSVATGDVCMQTKINSGRYFKVKTYEYIIHYIIINENTSRRKKDNFVPFCEMKSGLYLHMPYRLSESKVSSYIQYIHVTLAWNFAGNWERSLLKMLGNSYLHICVHLPVSVCSIIIAIMLKAL